MDFLRDHERMLDLPIEIEDGHFVVDVPLPRSNQQLTMLPSKPRARRGASLRDEVAPLDQQLLDEIVSGLQTSADVQQEVAELSSTLPAADLPTAIRRLEDSTGVDTAALRKDIAQRREPLRVELPDQTEFVFPVPPAVRKTVVAESPVALYVKPSGQREAVDVRATVMRKFFIQDRRLHVDPVERTPGDRFELERNYEFRFSGAEPAQSAVILAAWALGYDFGVLARFATSTSTLKAAPAEVDEVIGWARLARAVADAVMATEESPYRPRGADSLASDSTTIISKEVEVQ